MNSSTLSMPYALGAAPRCRAVVGHLVDPAAVADRSPSRLRTGSMRPVASRSVERNAKLFLKKSTCAVDVRHHQLLVDQLLPSSR